MPTYVVCIDDGESDLAGVGCEVETERVSPFTGMAELSAILSGGMPPPPDDDRHDPIDGEESSLLVPLDISAKRSRALTPSQLRISYLRVA